MDLLSRRELLKRGLLGAAALTLPRALAACAAAEPPRETAGGDVLPDREEDVEPEHEDLARLAAWAATLRAERLSSAERPLGLAAARVGELATGTPYEAFTLEAYLHAGGSPSRTEPLTLSLTRFDCVSLVEACQAVARTARKAAEPSWQRFGREMERMRYRGGERGGYVTRLHYFSEWIHDGARRGLLRDLGADLGGREDRRPLRFMTTHRDSYPALRDDAVYQQIGDMERRLDDRPRHVVPRERIPAIIDRLETGDVIAFATGIAGLDVSHAAFAFRDARGTVRVLHAPLSGGVVEITRTTLPEYVAAIRGATGILVARPV